MSVRVCKNSRYLDYRLYSFAFRLSVVPVELGQRKYQYFPIFVSIENTIRLKPIAILFQTGYLTIQEKDEDGLIQLDYPNKEVRDSMLEIIIEAFVGVDAGVQTE